MAVNFPLHILPNNSDLDEEVLFSLVCSICGYFSKLFNIDMAAPCEYHYMLYDMKFSKHVRIYEKLISSFYTHDFTLIVIMKRTTHLIDLR